MEIMKEENQEQDAGNETGHREGLCASRRQFLFGAGMGALSTILLPGLLKNAWGEPVTGQLTTYPRMLVGKLSQLKVDQPVRFSYPGKHKNQKNLLVMLGVPAMGGIGPKGDVVAFNTLCVHMGGSLEDLYNPKYKTMGPCEFHLSTYDLTKHGMITSAHATQNLPQIVLEAKGDEIYAVGVLGLIYGFPNNLMKV